VDAQKHIIVEIANAMRTTKWNGILFCSRR